MAEKRSLRRMFQVRWRGQLLEIPWIITERNLEGGFAGDIFTAVRWCEECQEDQPLFDFLVRLRPGTVKGTEYLFLDIEGDANKCYRYFEPIVIPVPDTSSTPLRVRLGAFVSGMGHRMKLRDIKTGSAVAPRHVGTRLVRKDPKNGDMTPKEIRLQPYADRGAAHDGTPYKGKKCRAS